MNEEVDETRQSESRVHGQVQSHDVDSSSEEEEPRMVRGGSRNQSNSNDFRVELPEFEGKLDPEEFVDWLNTVERVFEYKDISDDKKVKLVALRLIKYASLWWTNLNAKRLRERKAKIGTWEKMKTKLKARFLPPTYVQDCYSQFHNLTQGNMSVEEYTREFEKLMIKCDIQEPEEQTIVRYLGGLEPRYSNVVELQAYTSFDEVCVLAHKVEQQKRLKPFQKPQSTKPFPRNKPFNKGSSNPPPKPQTPFPSYPQRTPTPQKAPAPPFRPNPNPMSNRRCFKCQGLGHIASECPNRKVITLAEWTAVKEDFEEEEREPESCLLYTSPSPRDGLLSRMPSSA